MKTISTLITVTLLFISSFAFSQTFQNFEGGPGSIYGNCWTYSSDINLTSVVNKGGPLSGTQSMITLPPVNDNSKDWLYTPYLDLSTGDVKVSFKYALNTKLAGNAYRYIKIGLTDKYNNTQMLDSIYLDKTAPVATRQYEKKFILNSTTAKRLFVEFSGNTGDGNSRLIFDDLYVSANYFYNKGPLACNVAPIAVNDAYLGVLGTSTSGNLTANDKDPDGEMPSAAVVSTTPDGKLLITPNGSFTFTPSKNFVGGKKVVFTYQLNDNGYTPLSSNIATVTIDYSMSLLTHKLLNFDGKLNNGNLSLKWAVANNESLKAIEVQQSLNGKDFTAATTIAGTVKEGNENYYYNGRAAFSGNMTYRLKMVDVNNEVSYSKLIAVQAAPASNDSYIKFVSGQQNQDVNIGFQSASGEVVKIRVIDMSGNVLHVGTHRTVKGTNVIAVPVSASYTKGIYVVQLSDTSDNYVAKFVKQ